MPDEIPVERIESALRSAAVPILFAIIAGLLILRYARPLIRRVLRRVFESQARFDVYQRLTPDRRPPMDAASG